ncbi:MAG: hypothetical protein ACI8ZB_003529 [Desulforhopalus sp.]|jgi:hypothetical protein
MTRIESCVTPEGEFKYGIHKPTYEVTNLRPETKIDTLGKDTKGNVVDNRRNYPDANVSVKNADWIFEIPNPLPFRGRTFIDKVWADASANNYKRIRIQAQEKVSFSSILEAENIEPSLIDKLPQPLQLALATSSTDPEDLIHLAHLSCEIVNNRDQTIGLLYKESDDRGLRPVIHNHLLFEAVANNPHLPDSYKIAMVIRPGAQGGSEIVGEYKKADKTHVFEYLRRNSYISGGHYAANMADDAIRYSISELQSQDVQGIRHLYYQRTYIRLAESLNIALSGEVRTLTESQLEGLRQEVLLKINSSTPKQATLWGWNFGFDYAPTGYRLHASHQQVHQQYAMVPESVQEYRGGTVETRGEMSAYCCGDLVTEVIDQYRNQYGSDFFIDYQKAILHNIRMDERADLSSELIVYRDEQVILFVPKAQTSQWELQLMPLIDKTKSCPGNILECDDTMRRSLDTAIYKAQQALAGLGAQMVTSIEYSKRIGQDSSPIQPLLYAFLPRLPESPGAFSEAQLRFINGHYPEDFAAVCREQLQ